MWSTPQGRSIRINLGDFLRHFFRVKHEELMCLSVRFFGRCFSREIYGTREVEKNANCVEVRDIKNIKSKWVALQKSLCNHLPEGSSLTKDSPEFTYATYASPRMSSIVGNLNLVLVIALSTAWLHELVTPSQTLGYLGLETALDDLGYIDHGERMIWGVLKMGDPQVTMFNMFPSSNGNCLGIKSGG